ncbi:MAG: aspartate aminotransferase family protein [Synechococcus sp. MED650]|nr:aspartate aminotransferase family protein [Synechococcus sp. MED650]OUW57850.1 MAG: aspartate aminotransferase family protein [Cyanobacteria bacterium TMED188]
MTPLHARPDHPNLTDRLEPFASAAALDPGLREFLHRTADLLCHWIGSAESSAPLPLMRPLPEVAPTRHGRDVAGLLQDLQRVMDGAYQPSHPGALAHLDPPPLTASIAAELVCAGLNNNLLAEELSPGLTGLEHELCRWFCHRIGLPSTSGGVLASGGTLSNLMALVTARMAAGAAASNAVVLCSEDAHVSLAKAVRVMGLAGDGLQELPVDAEGRLCAEAVERRLTALRDQGRPCVAVVATAGTTVRGAIDPLIALADVCEKAGVWLHVDAAIGGVFALSNAHVPLVSGLERADSITLNPQKLLGITKASSLLLLQQRDHLRRAFSTGLPYMQPPTDLDHGGEMGLQGTRPAEVLKLWLGLRQLGEEGIEAVLASALHRRALFAAALDPHLMQVLPGDLHVLAMHPTQMSAAETERWSESTRQSLLASGFMLSRPRYRQRFCLKAVFGNPHTTESHLNALAQLLHDSLR